MPIRQQNKSVIIQTLPDADGNFEETDYQKQDNDMVRAQATYYQVYKQTVRVPKKFAQEVRECVAERLSDQLKNLKTEDQFVNALYLMPTDQKSIYLRNTQRQCNLCSGPHLTYQCPLKSQKQMQVNRQYNIVAEENTYSVRVEPIPKDWDKRRISEFVEQVFRAFEKTRDGMIDEITRINKEIEQSTDERERELLECSKLPIQQEIDQYLVLGTEDAHPLRIVILTSFQDQESQFAFVHFKSDDAARLFSEMQPAKVLGDNILIKAEYKGKRVNRK